MKGYSTIDEIQKILDIRKGTAQKIFYEARKLADEHGIRNFRGYAPNRMLNKIFPEAVFEVPNKKAVRNIAQHNQTTTKL